jgi:AraC-like DNA-binding protein
MAHMLLNPFDQRQVMRREDFEVFHYNNPACCSCPPHQHDFFELFFLLDDCIDDIVEGMRYSLGPGSVVLVPPGQMHRPDVPGPVRSIDRFVLWISKEYVRSITDALPQLHYVLWGDMTGRNLIQPDDETAAMFRQLLFALHREDARPDADSSALARSIIAQLLIYCSRSIASRTDIAPHKAEQRYREIMRVYEHIVANLPDRDLTVGALAERFFMDKNTLTRQFKRQVGMTPGECIRRHRLEAVRRQIRRGAPMQQACAECGFSDYSAFYRAFRQAYGISPRDYAAQAVGSAHGADERQEATHS